MTNVTPVARVRRAVLLSGLLLATIGPAHAATQEPGALEAYGLRCEARIDPLGVDRPEPRLSWKVRSKARDERQTRWQVVAATSLAAAGVGQGDLWDSGVVDGDPEAGGVHYGGRVLQPHQDCYWAVRVWDTDDRPSTWSDVARFSVGALDASFWQHSEWIGYDASREPPTDEADLGAARWIGHAADRSDASPLEAPAGDRVYARSFELSGDEEVGRAELTVLADNRATCVLNGSTVFAGHEGWQFAEPVDVTALLRAGANDLRIQVHNDDAGPSGLLVHLRIEPGDVESGEGGPPVEVDSDGGWRSAVSYAGWDRGELHTDAFAPVAVLGEPGMAPWGEARRERLRLSPVPLLRRSFDVARPVSRALLYGTALGLVDFHLNGARVSDERFTPGWTDYRLRVPYRCWDVTDRLRAGENVLGASLADGWYCGYVGWGRRRDHYGTAPRLRCVLWIEYEGGESVEIPSDGSWRAAPGPTREADFLMGERYDARAEREGWDAPGFASGADWDAVVTGAEHDPAIGWHPGPPVVAIGEFPPVGLSEPQDGVYVFDLGRNFAGVVRLKARAPAGTEVRLRFGERLKPDGTLYVANLRGARSTDTYVCKGEGVEVWEPRFTFHGFQYVEVTGLPESPPDDVVTGVALSSDTPVAGSFECSNPMLNQLASNVFWTQRANFIDVPTDCPQRDERLGWTGDAQVYARTATLWCDVQSFFDKWLTDLADAQRGDGQFPMVAPLTVAGSDGGPAWADAGTIVPWTMYQAYGDRQLLRRQYPSMLRYVAFCQARSEGGVTAPAEFHCFGDWLSIDAPTPIELIYCAYYARSVELTARAAEVLGEEADAERLWALHARVAQAYRDRFLAADGKVQGDTQCGYVLTLACRLADEPRRPLVAAHLIERIEDRDMHLSTGFIGTKDLMLVLAEIGREDVAWRLIENDTFPSWGFSIRQGATSIWERWDGWTPDKAFQDPGMNSFAHYSFGAVYEWMVENIGGIRASAPGYGELILAPRPGGGVTWAKVRYDSARGPIRTDWRIEGGVFTLDVDVPAGSSAVVVLPPEADAGSARIDGADPERTGVSPEGDRFPVGSGHWQFTAPWHG